MPPPRLITASEGTTDLGLIAKLLVDGLDPQVAAVQIRASILEVSSASRDNALGISGFDPLVALGDETIDGTTSRSIVPAYTQYLYGAGPFNGVRIGRQWVAVGSGAILTFDGDHGTADTVASGPAPIAIGVYPFSTAVPQLDWVSTQSVEAQATLTVTLGPNPGNIAQVGLTPAGVTVGAALGAGAGGAFTVAGGIGFEWIPSSSAFWEFVIYNAIGAKLLGISTGIPGGSRVRYRLRRRGASGLISAKMSDASSTFTFGPAVALFGFVAAQSISSLFQAPGPPGPPSILSLLDKSVARIVVA